jgi:hypothetical protein
MFWLAWLWLGSVLAGKSFKKHFHLHHFRLSAENPIQNQRTK